MNEAIAKQEELTALVLLLADGLMGKLLVQLVLLVSSAGAFLILLFLVLTQKGRLRSSCHLWLRPRPGGLSSNGKKLIRLLPKPSWIF
jgi:hypothetical protein